MLLWKFNNGISQKVVFYFAIAKYNMLPNGKWKQHFVMCKNLKDAEEKATHYPGSQGALYHTCTNDKEGNIIDPRPHFHPCKRLPNGQLDEENGKIPSVHFCFIE